MLSHVESQAPSDYWTRFAEFDRPKAMEQADMQLGHLLTHGHALALLTSLAPQPLLSNLDVGHRKRMHTLRDANAEEINPTPLRRRFVDPRHERYWLLFPRLGDMQGHAVKYAYSFLDLRRASMTTDDFKAFGRIVWPGEREEL